MKKRPIRAKVARPTVSVRKIGGIGSEALEKATGKSWAQWIRVLDRHGARNLAHRDIAQLVHDQYGVGDWWSQMVTVGYEQACGLRQPHETARGFQAGASKTVHAPLSKLFEHWSDERLRAGWLPDQTFVIRKQTRDKSMRITWPDGTGVEVNFYSKGPGKSQVAVQHGKLKSARDVSRVKKYWGTALERLKAVLE